MLNMSGLNNSTTSDESGRKAWKWMLIDSVIIGAIGFFSSLPEGVPTYTTFYIAIKAFGLAFVIQLAMESGLKRK